MAEFKLTINNPKTGMSYKKDLSGSEADTLVGKDIGENIAGDALGFAGYDFEITGGSDKAGFPMRHGLKGGARQRIFTYKGVGFSGKNRWKKSQDGLRVKTTVRGQKVSNDITQINLKIVKEGSKDLFEKNEETSVDLEKGAETAPEVLAKEIKQAPASKEAVRAPEEKDVVPTEEKEAEAPKAATELVKEAPAQKE